MWHLFADESISPGGTANLWLLMITIVTTLGNITSIVITTWNTRGSNATHDDISEAVQDAIDEYRTTFTIPLREENRRLRKQLDDERKRRLT